MRDEVCDVDGTLLKQLHGRATLDAWIRRVVDGWALDHLRVIDLSVVPHVPRANTNLTAIMIREYMASVLQAAG